MSENDIFSKIMFEIQPNQYVDLDGLRNWILQENKDKKGSFKFSLSINGVVLKNKKDITSQVKIQ